MSTVTLFDHFQHPTIGSSLVLFPSIHHAPPPSSAARASSAIHFNEEPEGLVGGSTGATATAGDATRGADGGALTTGFAGAFDCGKILITVSAR
jgi:hypothetical protein